MKLNPTIGFIGYGKVAHTLAQRLTIGGYGVKYFHSPSLPSQATARETFPHELVGSLEEIVPLCDVLFLTVPDDELRGLVLDLVASGLLHGGQMLVHTSGRHGVEPLMPTFALGCSGLALHPAMPFTGGQDDLENITSCIFGITASDKVAEVFGGELAESLGAGWVHIDEENRRLYHAALAHGANNLVELVIEASNLLKLAGVSKSRLMLQPLMEAALHTGLNEGINGLTGPIPRGDARTVAAHVRTLEESAIMNQALNSYKTLSGGAQVNALEANIIDNHTFEALQAALAGILF